MAKSSTGSTLTETTAWRRVGRLPTARNYARSVVYRNRIYVVGGSTVAGGSHSSIGSRVVEWLVP